MAAPFGSGASNDFLTDFSCSSFFFDLPVLFSLLVDFLDFFESAAEPREKFQHLSIHLAMKEQDLLGKT
jgi:hypothetical protein